jgi:hypothetical protein
MKNTLKFALTAALFAATPLASAEAIDCVKVSASVKSAVAADADKVLEIVASQITANQSCAGEVVKAAIIASDASVEEVAKIVATAILEAPSQLRVIAQCAIAVAPDAINNIQSVVEKYAKAGGEGHDHGKEPITKSDAKTDDGNPLDFPGGDGPADANRVGPRPGAPGSFTVLPPALPPVIPPVVTPPTATPIGS